MAIPKRAPASPDIAPLGPGSLPEPTYPKASRPTVTSNGAVRFIRAVPSTNRRMIVSACGEEKSGKNYFSFTFPEPIYVHSFDEGLEGTIEQFIDKKEIHVAKYDLEVQPGKASPQEVAESADKLWNEFVVNYKYSLAAAGDGTVVIDTDTELYELLRLARFGKLTQVMPHHYGPVNAEFRDIVRGAYDVRCNLFLIGRLGDEWMNDAAGKGNKTGARIRKGFGDLPYLTQINALCERVDRVGGGSDFQVQIESCRQNPECNGTTVANDYEMLRLSVFGG